MASSKESWKLVRVLRTLKEDTNRPLDEGIKINKKTAEAFVRRQKRSYPYYERYYETFKSPMEMKHEQCENYAPCDYYSEIIGFQAAYSLVFGRT
ncbi:PREDICTED: matrix Gla protein-like isoform X2 [Gekko japonicus]|uniref:Matrix Gla protein-like isoform X2 n=1 Tax=Gekko japonicus TaxID=146911 RepID=A0ABM1KSX0_GEKJA|nr:PREDICTED: matrix Gla protein-like isoform X2 [Gekko japonicus]